MEAIAFLPPALYAAARSLAGALERCEPVAALRAAQARLDADEHARTLLEDLDNAGAELRRRQSQQTLTREDIETFRTLQQRARSNPAIAAWIHARDEATAYLPEVNMRISELTGWDFAAMAAPPATCWQGEREPDLLHAEAGDVQDMRLMGPRAQASSSVTVPCACR